MIKNVQLVFVVFTFIKVIIFSSVFSIMFFFTTSLYIKESHTNQKIIRFDNDFIIIIINNIYLWMTLLNQKKNKSTIDCFQIKLNIKHIQILTWVVTNIDYIWPRGMDYFPTSLASLYTLHLIIILWHYIALQVHVNVTVTLEPGIVPST